MHGALCTHCHKDLLHQTLLYRHLTLSHQQDSIKDHCFLSIFHCQVPPAYKELISRTLSDKTVSKFILHHRVEVDLEGNLLGAFLDTRCHFLSFIVSLFYLFSQVLFSGPPSYYRMCLHQQQHNVICQHEEGQ